MHSAIGGPKLREESWRAFEWAKKEKLVRSIGVSNCRSSHQVSTPDSTVRLTTASMYLPQGASSTLRSTSSASLTRQSPT